MIAPPAVRVADRLALTLAYDGRTVGILTAYDWEGGLFLEDVLTSADAPAWAFRALLDAGLEEAKKRGAPHVGVFQPYAGMDPRLQAVAAVYGFTAYEQAEDGVYLVLRLKDV